jgi:hypothetical protein
MVVLDNTYWSSSTRLWKGRVAQFTLVGDAVEVRDFTLDSARRDMTLVAASLPWILLQSVTWVSGDWETLLWLARLDDGRAWRLAHLEGERALGFARDGAELWCVDEKARVLRRYALPQR